MTTPTMHLDCDGVAGALADYLDGDASDGVRSAVDAHAGSCTACYQLLADLSAVRVEAARLPLLEPSRELWSGIAERIDARVIPMEMPRATRAGPARRPLWRPAVAAAALIVVTAGATYYLTRASLSARMAQRSATTAQVVRPAPVVSEPPATIASTSTEAPAGRRAESPATTPARLARAVRVTDTADPVFASEITKLRKIVRERRSALDPKTVAVLEQSIAVMDSAIAQSRAALAKDPASGFLATQLNHSLEKKVELLRTAAMLPTRI